MRSPKPRSPARAPRNPGNHHRKAPVTAGFAARKAATDILQQVLGGGQSLDDAFAGAIAAGALKGADGRDRALVRLILATSLRRLAEINGILAGLLSKPLGPKTGQVREILVTGIAQMVFLGIAAHAVVNVATALASADRHGRHYKNLVNGVLRNVARAGFSPLEGEAAVRTNFPPWLLDGWISAYGEAAALAGAACLFDDPPLDLTVKSASGDWAARLGGVVLENGTVRVAKPGRIEALEGYEDGEWWVQDVAASMPARLIAAGTGQTVVDLCAAPGGKTAQLALTGAHIIAIDRDDRRAGRLAGNLQRLGLEAQIIVADAIDWSPAAPVDAVLLDAPCSATGIFRRHPDILHRRTPGQIKTLTGLQTRLIDASLTMLMPGATLVYCTCSLEKAEGEDQISAALSRHDGLKISAIDPAEVPGFENSITENGCLRILTRDMSVSNQDAAPKVPGCCDGFFVARLKYR